MNRIVYLFSVAIALGSLISLNSCKKEDDPGPSKVAFINASPDGGIMNVVIKDSASYFGTVGFSSFLGYKNVDPGNQVINIKDKANGSTLINSTYDFEGDKAYTLVAVNQKSSLEVIVFNDTHDTPDTSKAYLRFAHLISNGPAVDIYIDGVKVTNSLSYKQYTNFASVAAKPITVEVKLPGTSIALFSLANYKVSAGKSYTIFAYGLIGGSGLSAPGLNSMLNN